MKLVNPVLLATVLSLIFIILGCGNEESPVDSTADPFKASTGSKRVHDPNSSKQGDTRGIIFDKYTAPGRFALQWGTQGTGDGQFNFPRDVAVASDGSVYVADAGNNIDEGNNRIQKFTADGVFVRKWGTEGRDSGEFHSPKGVAVGSDGYVYVTDTLNQRIQKFTPDGVFVFEFGTENEEISWAKLTTDNDDNKLFLPVGIAVGSDGSVYVADHCNYPCVKTFTAGGVFVGKMGTKKDSTDVWTLTIPGYVSLESEASVYFSDPEHHQIQKFTREGVLVDQWGTEGTVAGKFDGPAGIALSSDGSVYVADKYNHRIQKFTPNGEFVTEWGTEGTNAGEFNHPSGIAMGPDGYLYVADTLNHRIQKFEFPAP